MNSRFDRGRLRPSSLWIVIRGHRWIVAASVALLAVAGFAYGRLAEKQYEASTTLLVRDVGVDTPDLASAIPEREVNTNLAVLELGVLEPAVDKKLNRPFTGDVEAEIDGEDTNLATITVTDSDPGRAARVANLYARAYLDFREQTTQDQIEKERALVQGELDALPPGARDGRLGDKLREQLSQLAAVGISGPGAEQLDVAEPPSSASSPKPLQYAVIGALLGLAIGIALAIALERGDRRIRDASLIERIFGRPVIGRVPSSRALAKAGPATTDLPPAAAEAFRTVRANLRRELNEREARSVMITSAIPREGKTTLAWNLARMEAALGSGVLLIEADMRRPVLAHSLGANGAKGLSELLAGEAKLQDLIQPVHFQGDAEGDSPQGTVDVLFAGTRPENPAELLDSERMQAILEVVPDSYDLVLFDTPPALLSDAMPMLDQVAGVLVVGRLGVSTDEAMIELRDELERFDTPILGVVVNGARPRRSGRA